MGPAASTAAAATDFGNPLMMILSLLGGGIMAGGGFGGKPGEVQQATQMTPEQEANFQQLQQMLGGSQELGFDYINQILSGDPEALAKFEAPYKRQFNQETVPKIAEQFAGLGSGGSLSSSGLQQSLGQAGRELNENLAALRGNLQQGALGSLQGMQQQAFKPTFENLYKQPQAGFGAGLMQGAGQGGGFSSILSALGIK